MLYNLLRSKTLKLGSKFFSSIHQKTQISDSPLRGLRILDLSRILAGPLCTQMLGDMGAEVIKVEQPGLGDGTRSWGPPFVGSESTYFLGINRNKKSIIVDMKTPKGKELVIDLIKQCDVLVENFVPGKMKELGLGWDDMRLVNPRLIYCSISGFGATGPMSNKPGFDIIVSAMYGLMSITGPEDGEEVKPGVALVDICTALTAHGAILAALYERTRSNTGQLLETSLMETQLASLANISSAYLISGVVPTKRWGSAHPSIG